MKCLFYYLCSTHVFIFLQFYTSLYWICNFSKQGDTKAKINMKGKLFPYLLLGSFVFCDISNSISINGERFVIIANWSILFGFLNPNGMLWKKDSLTVYLTIILVLNLKVANTNSRAFCGCAPYKLTLSWIKKDKNSQKY